MPTREYLSKVCSECGTASLFTERASGEGAALVGGGEVHAGRTVTRCDSCGAVQGESKPKSSAKRKPARKPARKTAKPKSSAKRKPARKPAAKKGR